MGGKESVPVEIKGHPEEFYLGAEEVKLGRYHDAELYFQQALRKHEGRAFWVEVLNAYWGKRLGTGKGHYESEMNNCSREDAAQSSNGISLSDNNRKFNNSREESSQHASPFRMRYIDLPFDDGLIPILDYLRLKTDIMNAYLCRELNDRNCNLALVHCCYLGTHLQLLFYFLYLWEAENADVVKKLEDGTLFEIDEHFNRDSKEWNKSKNHHKQNKSGNDRVGNLSGYPNTEAENILKSNVKRDPQNDAEGIFSNNDSASYDIYNSPKNQFVWKSESKDEIPSSADILLVKDLLFAFLRHHWMAVVFNYCILAMLYAENHCLPTEVNKINLISQNVLAASSSCIWELTNVLKAEGEKNALAASILKKMPPNSEYKFDVDEVMKEDNSEGVRSIPASHEGIRASVEFFASLTGNSSSTLQTFLALSLTFAPTFPLMNDTNINVPLRFNIRIDTPKSKLCTHRLRHPGSYNIFHYSNWFAVQEAFQVAGYNSYYLNKVLPYYNLPKQGEESSFMVTLKAGKNQNKTGVAATHIKRDKNFKVLEISTVETFNFVDPALKILMEKTDLVKNQETVQRIKDQKNYFNPLLRYNDMHTIKAIALEEYLFDISYTTLAKSKIFSSMGRSDEAEAWRDFILFTTEQLYSKESQEYVYMGRIVASYRA